MSDGLPSRKSPLVHKHGTNQGVPFQGQIGLGPPAERIRVPTFCLTFFFRSSILVAEPSPETETVKPHLDGAPSRLPGPPRKVPCLWMGRHPPPTNMATAGSDLEDQFPFEVTPRQVPCLWMGSLDVFL